MTLPAELKAQILKSAREKSAPTRRSGRITTVVLASIAVGVAFTIFLMAGGFAHGEGRPIWFELTTVVGWSLVSLWATWGAFRRPAMLGRTRKSLIAIAVATPLVLLAFMLQFEWTCPAVTEPMEGKLGFKCLGLGLAMGAVPLVALSYARRASDPVHPLATGAALGAAAGAWAGVVTDFWCPVADPRHILIGHILPIVLLTLVGLALGKWLIGIKAKQIG